VSLALAFVGLLWWPRSREKGGLCVRGVETLLESRERDKAKEEGKAKTEQIKEDES
jgi:hypothetical protein